MVGSLKGRLGLMKVPISALSAAATLPGYMAWSPELLTRALLIGLSVFLLSAGACTLNNYQDRFFDRQMERTRRRPLPSNRLSPLQGLFQAAALLIAGMTALLLCSFSLLAPLWGLLAVALYNGLYTPLKKKSLIALLPGVACGMVPPLIGWFAAGGKGVPSQLIYLCMLFGVWQIPHLWLLTLANSRDYMDPERPSFMNVLSADQMKRLVMIWILAFAFLTLLLRCFQFIDGGAAMVALVANAMALPLIFALTLYGDRAVTKIRFLFLYLNASVLGVTIMAVKW